MSRPRGKAYKITRKQVRSYGYTRKAGSGHRPNAAGVTTIAAINGRGAYRKRSARSSMRSLKSRTQRVNRARRQLTSAQKSAMARKFRAAKSRVGVSPQKRSGFTRKLRNAKRSALRSKAARTRAANRLRAGKRRQAGEKTMKTRRRRSHKRHRRNYGTSAGARKGWRSRRAKARKAPARRRRVRRHRKNYGTSAGARKGWRTRRAHARKGRKVGHSRRRRARKSTAAARLHAKRVRAGRKAARTRAARRVARHMQESMGRGRYAANRRRKHRRNARRRHRRNAMVENPRRRRRRARKAKSRRRSRRRTRHVANRRRHRRNRRSYAANRRRTHRRNRRHASNRRRHRRNRRTHRRNRGYRRNPMGVLKETLRAGAFAALGLIAEKLFTGVLRDQVLARITGSAATATPPAASGLEVLQPYNGLIASAAAAALGALVANKVVKNPADRNLILAGLGAGFVHSVVLFALDKVGQPKLVAALSGEATATRLSAMYGMGATSLMPRYAPAAGVGEYFSSGVSGMGEYFSSGVSGLGAYEQNPDLYQAAAGVGDTDNAYGHSNHVMPGSNLDRELSIAEAAAGIGALQPYEASAGFGEYFSSGVSGLGATVPSRSTWIPGQSDPSLWAGVRPVNQPQSATEMQPAGLLETSGGQGIFG